LADKEEVKRKLLYLSLDGDAHIWFRSMNEEYRLDWENMKKAFYLKYYAPIEGYSDRATFITSGFTREKVSLKLGGG
jgi:hypothetical protein